MQFNKLLFAVFLASVILLQYILRTYAEQSRPVLVSPVAHQKFKPIKKPGSSIIFVSDRSGNQEIYQMNLDTKRTVNLTNNAAQDMNPQISPDGKFIVFYSNRDGMNKIYRMNLQDLTVTQLTKDNGDDYDPSYSPDGQKVVFKSTRDDEKGDIFLMNEDGSEQTNLTPDKKDTEEWDPVFSHDGSKIYFVTRNGDHLTDELYVMNADGSKPIKLTDNKVPDWYPAPNPHTNTLMFISKADPKAKDDLFLMDQNKKVTPLNKSDGNDADPSWSQSGDKIVFINDKSGNYDLYIMNTDGSNVQRIEETPSDELSPIFLP